MTNTTRSPRWVSSDHCLYITSENAYNNYSNSSTNILSFESSESVVTEKNGKHQSNDVKINKDFFLRKKHPLFRLLGLINTLLTLVSTTSPCTGAARYPFGIP
ncbi:unnamed protein product [Microthlaspi erraticum]|uniref:Uncharacterized protein n=1 Tax=Microthlaspi erraticum TaxID=1685480 RepID=A0A6D2J8E1_9BRAS|nr:unnamed protein product [Microthlaspi erraticum]